MDNSSKELTSPMNRSMSGKPKRSKIIYVGKDHPFFKISNKTGNISEPRLIMGLHLGRVLTKDEVVLLKDGDCSNTSISNILLLTRKEANLINLRKLLSRQITYLQARVSVMEEYLTKHKIDFNNLTVDRGDNRDWEVDRDRELYEKSRRGLGTSEDAETDRDRE